MHGKNISVKAMCLILNDGKMLVNRGYDSVKGETFHRLIGGKVEFNERSIDAVSREITEELNTKVSNLKYVSVQEEIFTYEGEPGHEIIFIYSGEITDKNILQIEVITNPDSDNFPAVWVSVDDVIKKRIILYPSINFEKLLSAVDIS